MRFRYRNFKNLKNLTRVHCPCDVAKVSTHGTMILMWGHVPIPAGRRRKVAGHARRPNIYTRLRPPRRLDSKARGDGGFLAPTLDRMTQLQLHQANHRGNFPRPGLSPFLNPLPLSLSQPHRCAEEMLVIWTPRRPYFLLLLLQPLSIPGQQQHHCLPYPFLQHCQCLLPQGLMSLVLRTDRDNLVLR